MTPAATDESSRHYQVDPSVLREFRRWLSDYARAGGASETQFYSFLFNHPELVTCYLSEEQSVALRKELALSTGERVDLAVLFYGQSQYDLIECKGPLEPIIEERGPTRFLDASLVQLAGYRDAFMAGDVSDRRFRSRTKNQPRLVLIGDVQRRVPVPVEEQGAILSAALRSREQWKDDFERELLIVATWDMLTAKAAKSTVEVRTSRWCNNVVKDVLGNFAADKEKKRTSLPSLEEILERVLGMGYDVSELGPVEKRATAVIARLMELSGGDEGTLDPSDLNSQLQLADLLLYEDNGDMPCGPWQHGSTYGPLKILENRPTLWEEVTGHLIRALARDSSQDVLGRASHLLRYGPLSAQKLLLDDGGVRKLWKFPNPENLAIEPWRPRLVELTQVGYVMALHGDQKAIAFMNQAAATPHVVQDLARWNALHAKRAPHELVGSLLQKAEKPTEKQRPFLPWHKAILEATDTMLRLVQKC